MLGEDKDISLIPADDEVEPVVKTGLSQICSSFEKELSSLLLEPDLTSETMDGIEHQETTCHL